MPFSSNADIPPPVRNALPTDAQTIWRSAFNSAFGAGQTESAAIAIAWGAVKNAGFQRGAGGRRMKVTKMTPAYPNSSAVRRE